MLSKNISSKQLLILLILGFVLVASAAYAEDWPKITVIYPRDSQTVAAKDSTFIFGNITPPGSTIKLRINGTTVPVHAEGGFIAFLPITPGDFRFNLVCSVQVAKKWSVARDTVLVKVKPPIATITSDTLKIGGDYMPPDGDLDITSGTDLVVRFLGTPGAKGWFSLPGVADSVPMIETTSSDNPYWGQSTFGESPEKNNTVIKGIYTATYRLPVKAKCDSAKITYHLKQGKKVVTLTSGYRVSVNSGRFPVVVRLKDSIQILRTAPRKGYFTIFQPAGIEAVATGAEGDWLKLKFSQTQEAWVFDTSAVIRPAGTLLPQSFPTTIRSTADSSKVVFQIPLSRKHVYQIEETDRRTLIVRLYDVVSNTDWIRYVSTDSLVDYAYWKQLEPDVFEFTVTVKKDIWGYDSYYDGNTFCLAIIKAPHNVGSIHGKRIVIDPGHSADPGALGPTGFTEKQANLQIALELEAILKARGAIVTMTRRDSSNVPLYQRPIITKRANADLFVSVHNNSLPEGVNPFENNGTSTYYYHIHSMDLAKAIQTELIPATGLRDHGLYYGNFAVTRPTQYPAVLAECAFMIIPEQESLLKTKAFRLKLAKAIADGIESFLEEYANGN